MNKDRRNLRTKMQTIKARIRKGEPISQTALAALRQYEAEAAPKMEAQGRKYEFTAYEKAIIKAPAIEGRPEDAVAVITTEQPKREALEEAASQAPATDASQAPVQPAPSPSPEMAAQPQPVGANAVPGMVPGETVERPQTEAAAQPVSPPPQPAKPPVEPDPKPSPKRAPQGSPGGAKAKPIVLPTEQVAQMVTTGLAQMSQVMRAEGMFALPDVFWGMYGSILHQYLDTLGPTIDVGKYAPLVLGAPAAYTGVMFGVASYRISKLPPAEKAARVENIQRAFGMVPQPMPETDAKPHPAPSPPTEKQAAPPVNGTPAGKKARVSPFASKKDERTM